MKAAVYGRKTLPELLLTVAEGFPEKGVGFVQSDGSISFVTYPELLARARTLAAGLQGAGLKPGDEVMVIMTRNEEIIPMAWACFLGGFIPAIFQPPVSFTEFNQPAQKIDNVFKILKDPRVVLSDDLAGSFRSTVIPQHRILSAGSLKGKTLEPVPTMIAGTDLAYIQFSSGSTGDPKGVMLTHKNILTNLAAINAGLDIHDSDIISSWMPLYHDMGFFGYHVAPVLGRCDHYLIDPVDFIKKPSLWPDIMDQIRCTVTGCPNFGQALLLRYMKNKEGMSWDLSALKAIVNGAEPISTHIMAEFTEKLSPSRLSKKAMMPAYGMAEATLAISFSDLENEPVIRTFNRHLLQREGTARIETEREADMIEMVSVGKALPDVEIRVVDERGDPLDEGKEGHIQVRGGGITQGYYNNPEATRQAFEQGWLKTGDKGFFFEGQLYITGRVKDIIFVRGQNLYAHDLENLAGKHAGMSYGKLIAGGWFDPQKGHDLVIVFIVGMLNHATCEICYGLRHFFRNTYGITIDVFVPIRSNQVPRTSSGKIQRYKLIEAFQEGAFDSVVAEFRKMLREWERSQGHPA
jgi:acyl-CoA synthetase (AMP-forming)/AMP-acid ligase II